MDTLQLGPWTFTPADFSINDGTARKELEPLLVKLLLCFSKEPGRIISRQELVDTIWQQSYVDDNAINRAISELRKALQHPALEQSPIKTHHRKGYSLQLPQASVTPHSPQAAILTNNTAPIDQRKPRWGLSGVAAVLVSAVLITTAAFWYWQAVPIADNPPPHEPKLNELTILNQHKVTWFKGIESRPLVSPDKQLLAYSHSSPDSKLRVVVRKLGASAGQLLQEVTLEAQDKMLSVQSWQPLSRNLLVQVVSKDGSSCEYQNYDFSQYPQYQISTLTTCAGFVLGNAQQSADGQTLYYSKSSAGMYSSNALLAENLTSGSIQTLLAAPSAGFGITLLALSADGSKLAYVLMPESNKPELYLYEPASREHRRIATLPMPLLLIGLEWSLDQQSLMLPGVDAILQINLADNSQHILKLPEDVKVGELSLIAENQAYISGLTPGSTTQAAMQLIKVSQPFDEDKRQINFLHDAAGSSLALAVSPLSADSYAFSANWTGGWQLWLNQNGNKRQLTELPNTEQPINDISWSNDGRYIAFIQQGNLYLYDTQRQQLINKREQNDVGQTLWLPDNSGLILTRVEAQTQNLWQLDLISNDFTQLTFAAGNFAQYSASGELLYHKDGKLYQYVDGAKQDKLLEQNDDANYMALWLQQGQQQYRHSMLGHVKRRNLVTGNEETTQLPYQLIAIHPNPHDPDVLYATAFITPELALEFIQWQIK